MTCKLGALVAGAWADAELSPADRELVQQWLDTGTDSRGRVVSATAMAQALTHTGYGVGPTTVKAHRSKSCSCYREG